MRIEDAETGFFVYNEGTDLPQSKQHAILMRDAAAIGGTV